MEPPVKQVLPLPSTSFPVREARIRRSFALDRVARLSEELQLIVMMAALAQPPGYAGKLLGIELIHADTYLALGNWVWRDSSENKVASA